ncbi:MAG: GldM family protein [Salinibacter sp.]|uniref:GldM family protein n=1 Tax=Salinibacter sp. TaxID=2065818 RepID=UPI0035D3FC8B
MNRTKELRYYVMLALYFPILLYAVSTFDVSEETYAVKDYQAVAVGEPTVVLGQPFEARAFLAARRLTTAGEDKKALRPQLVPRGDLSAQGDSLLVMNTSGLLPPGKDQKRVSYGAYFKVQQLGGATQRFPVSGSFTVRRPEIVAKTETAQALYRHTLNRIRLSVPGISNQSLRIEGPAGSTSGTTLSISPSGDAVTVDVYLRRSDGEDLRLGQRKFSVIDPPRPQIRVFAPQGEVTSGDPLERRRAVLRFRVEPDPEFRSRYPEDAQYEVTEATVYLRRGQTASQQIGSFELGDDGRLVLTQELQGAEPGDQVIVRLEKVVRVNHQGRRIKVPLRENSRTFGFVLS